MKVSSKNAESFLWRSTQTYTHTKSIVSVIVTMALYYRPDNACVCVCEYNAIAFVKLCCILIVSYEFLGKMVNGARQQNTEPPFVQPSKQATKKTCAMDV